MEIQKSQSKKDYKISKVDRIKNAVNDIKCRDIDHSIELIEGEEKLRGPIVDLMRYLFVLTGLKPENYPSEIEKRVFVNFIQTNYGVNSIDEIKVAFELATQRKLSDFLKEGDKINHFQTFSVTWFGGIMAAFHEYKIAERQRLQVSSKSTYSEPESLGEDFYLIQQLYKPYKKFMETGVYPWNDLDEKLLFAKLWKLNVIRYDKVELEKIKLKCIAKINLPRSMPTKQKETKINSACRSRGFREWIIDQCESLVDIEEIINQKLKEKWTKESKK